MTTTIPSGLRLVALSLAVALLAAGCAARGPNYKKPIAEVSDAWQDIDDPRLTTSAEPDVAEWWTVFDDEVLSSLVETARRENLTLQAAGLRVLEARARLGIATKLKWPQVQTINGGGANVSLSETDANTQVLDTSFNTVGASFNLAWELDFWGRFRRTAEAAQAGLEASMATYEDVLVTLTAEVARSYVLVCTFEERLGHALENVELQQRALKMADARFDNGLVSELDVQQATALLNNTSSRIPLLETGAQAARNALSVLLGRTPDTLDELLRGQGPIPNASREVTVGVPAELLRRRPDVRRAERQLAAQSARIGIAVTDLFPRFSLIGSVGFRSSDAELPAVGLGNELGDLFDSDSFGSFLGPFFSWNIFNYGRIKNNIRVQDARFQALMARYRNAVLVALAEADSAITAYLKANDQGEFLEKSAAAADRSVELALIQYREGLINFNTVLTALTARVGQRDALSVNQGAIATNMIALYKAVGGGWDPAVDRGLDEYVPPATQDEMRERLKAWRKVLPGTAKEEE